MKCRRINPDNGMIVWFGVKDVITGTTEVVSDFNNTYLTDDVTYDNFIVRHPELQGLLESLEVDVVTYGDTTQRDVTGLKLGNSSMSGNIKLKFKYEIASIDVYVTQYKQEKDTSCYVNNVGQQITAEQDDEPQKMTFTVNSNSFYIATKNLRLNNEVDYRMWLKKLVIRFNENIAIFQDENNKHANYATGSEGVANSLRQRLSVLKHELWYDYNRGMPLPDKARSKAIIDAYVIRTILEHPDVIDIEGFESEQERNNYTCYFVVNTIYGQIELGM